MLRNEQPNKRELTIIVKPNASLSLPNAWLFFAGITVVSLLIALRFLSLGAWMILPFAIAELAMLAWCLRLVLRNNQRMESIHIKGDALTLIRRDAGSEQRFDFNRYWVQLVRVAENGSKQFSEWHPMRLLLRSHGRSVEIGSFINHEEKQELESRIRAALVASR